MKKFNVGCGVFLIIATAGFFSQPAFSAIVPIESSIAVNAYANWGSTPATTVIQSDSDSQTSTINPLSASATAFVSDGSANSYTTSVDINVIWNNSESGTVSIVGVLDLTSKGSSHAFDGNFYSGGPNTWSYTFTPDTDGSIILHWDTWITTTNDYTGVITSEGIPTFQYYSGDLWRTMNPMNPGNPVVIDILGGMPFEFGIGWYDNSPAMGGQGNSTQRATGDFNWQFVPSVPVPVPAAVWFLGSGLIGLFAVKRNKTIK